MAEMIAGRLRAVRAGLKEAMADCLIVISEANVRYLTGFTGNDSWLLVTRRGHYLLTDSRYTEQAEKECRGCRIIERNGAMTEAAGDIIRRLKTRAVGVEKQITLGAMESLKKNIRGRIKTVGGIVEQSRIIKDGGEVASIRTAANMAGQALAAAKRYMTAGVTENELAGRLDFEIRRLGATSSFETIVAFGANASRPHHKPGTRVLQKNDTVLIDFGVKYKGYCSDITRCFTIGKVVSFYQRVYDAVERAQAAAIKTVRAGVEIRQVDAAAREIISAAGLPIYGHGTGHGLGLEIHEAPGVSQKSDGKLQPGMALTIEPGVYIPGKLGVRIEDDVVVTDRGCEILSRNVQR
jgi:Xaa-Pro aminopeptidase